MIFCYISEANCTYQCIFISVHFRLTNVKVIKIRKLVQMIFIAWFWYSEYVAYLPRWLFQISYSFVRCELLGLVDHGEKANNHQLKNSNFFLILSIVLSTFSINFKIFSFLPFEILKLKEAQRSFVYSSHFQC